MSELASPLACLVTATNLVYSASDEHSAFALVPKAHIDAWRCEASFLHAALLVLQADSAESSNDCAWTRACFLPSQEAFKLLRFRAALASMDFSWRSL